MTGLPRRDEFIRVLDRRLVPSVGQPCALTLLEIDGLKAVNALMGHRAGDALLSTFGERLAAAVPEAGVAARLDGAEFAVLAEYGTTSDLDGFVRHLRSCLQEGVALGDEVVHPVVFAGAAVADEGQTVDDVLGAANIALTAARERGTGYERYDPQLESTALARQALELAVREAVPRNELLVYYQPVVDLRDSRVVGAEALVRWARGPDEIVLPGEFIPAAEQSGAIAGIGQRVLEMACSQVADWNRRHRVAEPLDIGINVSVLQLSRPDFPAEVAGVVDNARLDPSHIMLEVTESALMDDAPRMIRRLEELKGIGLTLALDDFGTGYSSLSYLRQLPVDVLKIDRSFVDGIARSEEEWALTVAIVNLASSLGKQTLAEGVETPAQVAHLRALRCVLAQGYLFGRPLAPAQFEALLRAAPAADRDSRSSAVPASET